VGPAAPRTLLRAPTTGFLTGYMVLAGAAVAGDPDLKASRPSTGGGPWRLKRPASTPGRRCTSTTGKNWVLLRAGRRTVGRCGDEAFHAAASTPRPRRSTTGQVLARL